jgi:hypothetical protein
MRIAFHRVGGNAGAFNALGVDATSLGLPVMRLNIDTNLRAYPTSIFNCCVSFRLCSVLIGALTRPHRRSLSLQRAASLKVKLSGERRTFSGTLACPPGKATRRIGSYKIDTCRNRGLPLRSFSATSSARWRLGWGSY